MSKLIPFQFNQNEIRVIANGEDWFIAKDVCAALGIKNVSQALSALDADERSMLNIGRGGNANAISESGLYTLILRSRDATTEGTPAHTFKRWVTKEVLPALRKGRQPIPVPRASQLGAELQERMRISENRLERLEKVECDARHTLTSTDKLIIELQVKIDALTDNARRNNITISESADTNRKLVKRIDNLERTIADHDDFVMRQRLSIHQQSNPVRGAA